MPPTSAFLSKWYLAQGSLSSGLKVISWLGPLALIISALLTAGYLLGITLKAFFPGDEYDYPCLKKLEPEVTMLIPMLILTAGAVIMGIWAGPIIDFAMNLAKCITG